MTIFETWQAEKTPHSDFVRGLFELYQIVPEEDKELMRKNYPGYFVTDRVTKQPEDRIK